MEKFLADEPGTPLGVGMPSGVTLREDGETHHRAWKRIVREDVCAYCDEWGGTLDHIEPRSGATGGYLVCGAVPIDQHLHTWLNYAAACEDCNSAKGSTSLLEFLGRRVEILWPKHYGQDPRLLPPEVRRELRQNWLARQREVA
jgi:hypothetical protein